MSDTDLAQLLIRKLKDAARTFDDIAQVGRDLKQPSVYLPCEISAMAIREFLRTGHT